MFEHVLVMSSLRRVSSTGLLLALLVWAFLLGTVECRIHPTREHAAARSVTELRSFDMWALDSGQVNHFWLIENAHILRHVFTLAGHAVHR